MLELEDTSTFMSTVCRLQAFFFGSFVVVILPQFCRELCIGQNLYGREWHLQVFIKV